MQRSKQLVLAESFSKKDIIAFLIIFAGVLIMLFPAGRLERIILKEDNLNTYLHIKYLESLSRLNPSPDVLEALARSYASTGQRAKALEVAERLKLLPDAQVRSYRISYEILKHEYFSQRSPSKKEEILRKLRRLLISVAILEQNTEKLRRIYKESADMGFHRIALITSQRLAKKTGDDVWLEKAVLHALILRDYSTALRIAESIKDKEIRKKVLTPELYVLARKHRTALRQLKELMLRDPSARVDNLKDLFWLADKTGEDVYPFILSLIARTKNPHHRKMIILSALRFYLGKGEQERVKDLIDRYALAYPDDPNYTGFIIRSALATGDPRFAGDIAERIAKALEVYDDKGS